METFKGISEAHQPAPDAADAPPLPANNTFTAATDDDGAPTPAPENDATVAADDPPQEILDLWMTTISEFISGESVDPPTLDPMKLLAQQCNLPEGWGVYKSCQGGLFGTIKIRDENLKDVKKEEIHLRIGSTDFDLSPALKKLESINTDINNSLNDKLALGKKMLGIDNVALKSNLTNEDSAGRRTLQIWTMNGQARHFFNYQSFYSQLDVDDLPGELIPIREINCDAFQEELKRADDFGLNRMNNSKISAWTVQKTLKNYRCTSPTGKVYFSLSDAMQSAGFSSSKCLSHNLKQILELGFSLVHVHKHIETFISPDTLSYGMLSHFAQKQKSQEPKLHRQRTQKPTVHLHLFQSNDDALRKLLRSTNGKTTNGKKYIAPEAGEGEDAIIKSRLASLKASFIWDEDQLPDEETTAKKKKKASPSKHSQPQKKKPKHQQRRKKKKSTRSKDEEDSEEDNEDEKVVSRSTIPRSTKKEVHYDYDKEDDDDEDDKDDDDDEDDKDDDDEGHLESDCKEEEVCNIRKQNLIRNLCNMNVHLAPSNIHKVGVFAAVDIPKDTTLFLTCNQDIPNQTIPLSADEVDSLPSYPKMRVKSFILQNGSGKRHIPSTGLTDVLGLGMYMNSSYGLASHCTNVAQDASVVAVGSYGYTVFKTTKKVKVGEELLWNYKYLGCFDGKQGKFFYTSDDPGDPREQWLDGTVGEYISKDERNDMAMREGKVPTNKRGMYRYTVDIEGKGKVEEDYFSDEDETVKIDGVSGEQLWKEY